MSAPRVRFIVEDNARLADELANLLVDEINESTSWRARRVERIVPDARGDLLESGVLAITQVGASITGTLGQCFESMISRSGGVLEVECELTPGSGVISKFKLQTGDQQTLDRVLSTFEKLALRSGPKGRPS